MSLHSLSKMEMLALVGLLEYVVMADNFLTDDEEAHIQVVMKEIGAARYEELIDEFDAEYADEADFRSLLESITNQEVRDVLYGTILSVSDANTLMGRHSALLDWLYNEWNIQISIDGDNEEMIPAE